MANICKLFRQEMQNRFKNKFKTELMTNLIYNQNLQIDNTNIELLEKYKYIWIIQYKKILSKDN